MLLVIHDHTHMCKCYWDVHSLYGGRTRLLTSPTTIYYSINVIGVYKHVTLQVCKSKLINIWVNNKHNIEITYESTGSKSRNITQWWWTKRHQWCLLVICKQSRQSFTKLKPNTVRSPQCCVQERSEARDDWTPQPANSYPTANHHQLSVTLVNY